MKRTPLRRGKPLKPGRPPKRTTPLKAKGKRGRRFWKRVETGTLYGPYHLWIGRQRCIGADVHECIGPTVGHHLETGRQDAGNEIPVCIQAHRDAHSMTRAEFSARYGDPETEAKRLERIWRTA